MVELGRVGQARRGAGGVVVILRIDGERQQLQTGEQIPKFVDRRAHVQRGIVATVVCRKVDPEIVGRRQRKGAAQRERILVVVVAGQHPVLHKAVAPRIHRRDPGRYALGERAGHRAPEIELVERAVVDAEIGAQIVTRAAAHQFQRTADGVLAVERALRPTQHLDPFEVEQIELRPANTAEIDIVHIDADRRIEGLQGVGLAHAADEDVGRVGRPAALYDVEVRHRALQAGGVLCLDALQRCGIEGGDGGRDVFQRFLGAPCGDDDRAADVGRFVDLGFIGHRLGHRGHGEHQRPQCGPQFQGDERSLGLGHKYPPPHVVLFVTHGPGGPTAHISSENL